MKKLLLAVAMSVLAVNSYADSLGSLATQFQNGMTNMGFPGGDYSEDAKHVYWNFGSKSDFGDGNGLVHTQVKFRINKTDLQKFVDENYSFDEALQQYDIHTVKGYKFWSVHSISDTEGENALFLYPDVESEGALVKKILEFTNVNHAAMSNHGVLYVFTDDNRLHRGVLNYHMIPLAIDEYAAAGTVEFASVSDLNGDGHNDYSIIYDSGFKQYLYYLPPPF